MKLQSSFEKNILKRNLIFLYAVFNFWKEETEAGSLGRSCQPYPDMSILFQNLQTNYWIF